MSRQTRFELHILPMFRLIDRDHMAFQFDLHDPGTFYDEKGNPKIDFITHMRKFFTGELPPLMPPDFQGGPWPDEWLALFGRWIDEGCPRLQLAAAELNALRLNADTVRLNAAVVVPGSDYHTWFERERAGAGVWEYTLYMDSPTGNNNGDVTKFLAEQINDIPESVTTIQVHDAKGANWVSITSTA